ncbi:MAG: putative HTH-type transcriptional regulator yobV [Sphaerisporangium sp.]|nr:putative HTH-type transcriptional regulator yobV [Sphaerisporangium sp.]
MRADRLVAALLLMQARGRVTAAKLADELEVSVATARRDLEALSAAGIPVYPQPGRGGGWSLVGGARTDLSGLSATEAQALFLLVGPAAAVSGEAKAALRKLVRALPQTFRADAEAAASATMIDPTRWGERDRRRPEMVDIFKSLHVLTYVDDEPYRRDIKAIRNLQEGRHDLAKHVFHGRKGELRHRYQAGMEDQLGALGLVLNCITLWNTVYLDAALDQLRAQGYPVLEDDVVRLSPFMRKHINVHGHYSFQLPDLRGGHRELCAPDALHD